MTHPTACTPWCRSSSGHPAGCVRCVAAVGDTLISIAQTAPERGEVLVIPPGSFIAMPTATATAWAALLIQLAPDHPNITRLAAALAEAARAIGGAT